MKSVRMLAAGAVALFALPVLTAPVRACDDRYLKKCETESEAAFVAETQGPAAAVPRRKAPRVRAFSAERHDANRPRARLAVPRATPEPEAAPVAEAPVAEQPPAPTQVAALPESPMARRFRGFIDPQSIAVNSFED